MTCRKCQIEMDPCPRESGAKDLCWMCEEFEDA
jgi:hypothetical protein